MAGFACGSGGRAGHDRCESGLRRAVRPQLPGGARASQAVGAAWALPERYHRLFTLAHSGGPLSCIVQPLILPLYDGKTAHELLAIFSGQPGAASYDLVRAYWQTQYNGPDFETWWRRSVHDGLIADSAFPARPVKLQLGGVPPPPAPREGIEVMFRPDPCIYDGAFIN